MSERRRERKVVTVLFCDLVGFTQQAESLDPEDVEAVLRPYHARVRNELFPWAGTHRGHDGVRRWFDLLNAAMAYERFELLELYSDDETVVEVIAAAGKTRETGAPFASEVVRVWTSTTTRPSASGRTTTPMATPPRCSGRRPPSPSRTPEFR